jgi:hypothetical protein
MYVHKLGCLYIGWVLHTYVRSYACRLGCTYICKPGHMYIDYVIGM